MVGKGAMPCPKSRPRTSPRRCAAPIPSWTRSRGRRGARLPGRRRRPRPAARPRPRRPRPRRRGRRRRARRPARRRARSSTSASRPPRSSSTGTRSTSPRARTETYPSPAPCPRSTPAAAIEADLGRRDFTINAMAVPLRGEPRADRPPRRPRRPRARACCACCTRAPSSTTRPGRCAPPATPRASASSWSRRPSELLARDRPRHRLRRPPRRRAAAARRRSRGRAGASSCSPSGACSSCAPAAIELAARGRRAARASRLGASSRRADRGRCSPAALGRRAARAASSPPRGPGRPSEAVALAARPRPGRAGRWPGRWAPSGSTSYLASGARSRLEIDGADLIAAGVAAGPGGRARAWRRRCARKLDGEIAGRERGAGRGAAPRPRRGVCLVTAMEWRERDGVRWLRGRAAGAPGRLLDPARRRQRGALRRASTSASSPTTTDEAVVENRRAARRRARPRAGADRDRAARSTAPSSPSTTAPQEPSPFAEPGSRIPEVDGHVVADAAAWRRSSSSPTACRSPSPGPGGVAMLHCGWRGLAAGIVAARRRGGRRHRRRDRPRDRPLLLRGRRRGARRLRRPRRRASPTGRMLDLPEVARRLLARAGVERVEAAGLCTSCEPELFFSHRRDAGRTGRQAGLVWIEPGGLRWPSLIHGLDPDEDRAPTSSGCARPAGRRGRDPGRDASTCRSRRWGRWPRPASTWSARTASRTSPPSTSAGATPSSGTSSATCRAARSSSCCRSAG